MILQECTIETLLDDKHEHRHMQKEFVRHTTRLHHGDITGLCFLLFQLISMAVRNGDTHKHTMEMADYWLLVRSES